MTTMALSDIIEKEPTKLVRSCAVRRLAESLPEDDCKYLNTVLNDYEVKVTKIMRAVLTEYPEAYVPSHSSFLRHRRGECSCGVAQ